MNNYNNFGKLLEHLRLSNNMTQVEAADGICTLRQYSRLEKGESTPRIEILYGLSNKFNTNLYDYYNIHFCHQSFEAYQCIKDLNRVITAGNYNSLETIITQMKKLKEFEDGDNYKNLCYAQALLQYNQKKYDQSISFCLQGLQLSDFEAFKQLFHNQIYTNIELCLMNCLGCNYGSMTRYEEANIAFTALVNAFDYQTKQTPFSLAQNSFFLQNFYENAIYNIGYMYYCNRAISSAYNYVEKGIAFSISHNNISYLPSLLELKGYILKDLNKPVEAKECWQQALCLLKLQQQAPLVQENLEYIQKKYNSVQTQIDLLTNDSSPDLSR